MSFKKAHIESLIIRTLQEADPALVSLPAVTLLLGTVAHESKFGRYLRQNGGPAIGIFQMEPPTFDWLVEVYKSKYPQIAGRKAEEMEWDLKLAILMARLRYRVVEEPLPEANDVPGMAAYWNKYYNGNPTKGTDEEFIAAFNQYVKGT